MKHERRRTADLNALRVWLIVTLVVAVAFLVALLLMPPLGPVVIFPPSNTP